MEIAKDPIYKLHSRLEQEYAATGTLPDYVELEGKDWQELEQWMGVQLDRPDVWFQYRDKSVRFRKK